MKLGKNSIYNITEWWHKRKTKPLQTERTAKKKDQERPNWNSPQENVLKSRIS